MVRCNSCGKAMDKVPDWMAAVTVEFVCNNCPNRHTKNIAFITLEAETPTAKLADDEPDVEEIADPETEEA